MPSRVIALVYAHEGDGVYQKRATLAVKALLKKVNKALGKHHGFPVGTSFGDSRGKDENGKACRAYALCMTTPEAKVDWLIDTFWTGGSGSFDEQIPGVGYMGKGSAKVQMYSFDASLGDAGVQSFLADNFGIAWEIPKPKVDPAKHAEQATRLKSKTDDDDPLMAMERSELEALCDAAGVEYDDSDSQRMLRNLYTQHLDQ